MAPTALSSLVLPLLFACSAPGDPPSGEGDEVVAAAHDEPADAGRRHDEALASLVVPSDLDRIGLLTDAARALGEDRPEQALSLASEALRLDAASTLALFLQGVALLDLGRLDESAAALERAALFDPEDASTLSVLARVHYERMDLDAATQTLRRVLELQPEQARHWTSLGLMEFESGHWDKSYDAFLQAVSLDPRDAEAHHGLGRLYAAVGESEMAERAYRTALAARPDDPGLSVALGHVLRDLDRGDEAVDAYRTALRNDPDNPWITANLGSVLLELERLPEARRQFERALDAMDGPGYDHGLVLVNYGQVLDGLGDLDGARLAYEEAVEVDPSLGRAHALLGLLEFDCGRGDEARDELDLAFRLASLDPLDVVRLVLLHEQRGAWDLARDRARAVLDGDPSDTQVLLAQAQLYVRSRDGELRDVPRGVALLDGLLAGRLRADAAGWLLLAEVHETEGRLDDALDVLDQALGSVPLGGTSKGQIVRERDRLAQRLGRR